MKAAYDLADAIKHFAAGWAVEFTGESQHPIYPYTMVTGTVTVDETVLTFQVPLAWSVAAASEEQVAPASGMGDGRDDGESADKKPRRRARARRDK